MYELNKACSIAHSFLYLSRESSTASTLHLVNQYYEVLHRAEYLDITVSKVRVPIIINAPSAEYIDKNIANSKFKHIRAKVVSSLFTDRVRQTYLEEIGENTLNKYDTYSMYNSVSRIYPELNSYIGTHVNPDDGTYRPPMEEDICIDPSGMPCFGHLSMMSEVPMHFTSYNLPATPQGMVRAFVLWKYFQKNPEGIIKQLPEGIGKTGDQIGMELFPALDKVFEVMAYTTVNE